MSDATGPIPLAAVAVDAAGQVVGFTDIDACRAWLQTHSRYTVWTAEGFWRREREERAKAPAP